MATAPPPPPPPASDAVWASRQLIAASVDELLYRFTPRMDHTAYAVHQYATAPRQPDRAVAAEIEQEMSAAAAFTCQTVPQPIREDTYGAVLEFASESARHALLAGDFMRTKRLATRDFFHYPKTFLSPFPAYACVHPFYRLLSYNTSVLGWLHSIDATEFIGPLYAVQSRWGSVDAEQLLATMNVPSDTVRSKLAFELKVWRALLTHTVRSDAELELKLAAQTTATATTTERSPAATTSVKAGKPDAGANELAAEVSKWQAAALRIGIIDRVKAPLANADFLPTGQPPREIPEQLMPRKPDSKDDTTVDRRARSLAAADALYARKEVEDAVRAQFAAQSTSQLASNAADTKISGDLLLSIHQPTDHSKLLVTPCVLPATAQLCVSFPLIPKFADGAELMTAPVVVSENEFRRNWGLFMSGAFGIDFEWSNVLAAGGSVLSCLLPRCLVDLNIDTKTPPSQISGANGFHDSDIDLFIYGLEPEAATKKLRYVIDYLSKSSAAAASPVDVCISPYSVTVLGLFPTRPRHIQIILRCYASPLAILSGFDVDCCCVGFNVDCSRRSVTYESRLIKYAKRGFAVGITNLDLSQVDMNRVMWSTSRVRGCTELLRYHFQVHCAEPALSYYRRHILPYQRAATAARRCFKKARNNAAIAIAAERHRLARNTDPDYSLFSEPNDAFDAGDDDLGLYRGPNPGRVERLNPKRPTDHAVANDETFDSIAHSDYGWVPAFGCCTRPSLDVLYESNRTRFPLKDGSFMYLCRSDKLKLTHNATNNQPLSGSVAKPSAEQKHDVTSVAVSWVTINPSGQGPLQLHSGSFHPLSEAKGDWNWSDVSSWHVKWTGGDQQSATAVSASTTAGVTSLSASSLASSASSLALALSGISSVATSSLATFSNLIRVTELVIDRRIVLMLRVCTADALGRDILGIIARLLHPSTRSALVEPVSVPDLLAIIDETSGSKSALPPTTVATPPAPVAAEGSSGSTALSYRHRFRLPVDLVVSQVHPSYNLTPSAFVLINAFAAELMSRLIHESVRLARMYGTYIVTSRSIQSAVRNILVGELIRHGVSEGTRAVMHWVQPATNGTEAMRAGIQTEIAPVRQAIRAQMVASSAATGGDGRARKLGPRTPLYTHRRENALIPMRVSGTGPVYLAGVIEYVVLSEVCELAGNTIRDAGAGDANCEITVPAILGAIMNDVDLLKQFDTYVVPFPRIIVTTAANACGTTEWLPSRLEELAAAAKAADESKPDVVTARYQALVDDCGGFAIDPNPYVGASVKLPSSVTVAAVMDYILDAAIDRLIPNFCVAARARAAAKGESVELTDADVCDVVAMTRLWHEPRTVLHMPGQLLVSRDRKSKGFDFVVPPSTVQLSDTKEMEAIAAHRIGLAAAAPTPVSVFTPVTAAAEHKGSAAAKATAATATAAVADANANKTDSPTGAAASTRLSTPYHVWLSANYFAHRIERRRAEYCAANRFTFSPLALNVLQVSVESAFRQVISAAAALMGPGFDNRLPAPFHKLMNVMHRASLGDPPVPSAADLKATKPLSITAVACAFALLSHHQPIHNETADNPIRAALSVFTAPSVPPPPARQQPPPAGTAASSASPSSASGSDSKTSAGAVDSKVSGDTKTDAKQPITRPEQYDPINLADVALAHATTQPAVIARTVQERVPKGKSAGHLFDWQIGGGGESGGTSASSNRKSQPISLAGVALLTDFARLYHVSSTAVGVRIATTAGAASSSSDLAGGGDLVIPERQFFDFVRNLYTTHRTWNPNPSFERCAAPVLHIGTEAYAERFLAMAESIALFQWNELEFWKRAHRSSYISEPPVSSVALATYDFYAAKLLLTSFPF